MVTNQNDANARNMYKPQLCFLFFFFLFLLFFFPFLQRSSKPKIGNTISFAYTSYTTSVIVYNNTYSTRVFERHVFAC
ncbi:hypothetical protein QBC42DRAFT_267146 [Cladorrhinum samala]|uniref:Uncharacterized protein n=1 Tax=Cladorrhinum samala TaxID=585594 RepID=A0AAV9HT76_9PEZI|nr:hypothetical protein QBC42DRAFT_267146 [Cladorrhinum samala]